MIRFLLKSIFVAVLVAAIVYEIRMLMRLLGPEVAPIWSRVREEAARHGVTIPTEPTEERKL